MISSIPIPIPSPPVASEETRGDEKKRNKKLTGSLRVSFSAILFRLLEKTVYLPTYLPTYLASLPWWHFPKPVRTFRSCPGFLLGVGGMKTKKGLRERERDRESLLGQYLEFPPGGSGMAEHLPRV